MAALMGHAIWVLRFQRDDTLREIHLSRNMDVRSFARAVAEEIDGPVDYTPVLKSAVYQWERRDENRLPLWTRVEPRRTRTPDAGPYYVVEQCPNGCADPYLKTTPTPPPLETSP